MPIRGRLLMADFLVFSLSYFSSHTSSYSVWHSFWYSVTYLVSHCFSYTVSYTVSQLGGCRMTIFCRFWLSRSFAFMNFVG